MGGAPLLLALAIITADVGWESDGRAGYRYIIQVSPAQMAELEREGSVTSQIPVELQGRVTSVVLRVGNDPLPQPAIARNPSPDPNAPNPNANSYDLSLKTPYPAPPDTSTVRAQSGENGAFAIPTLNDVRESGQQALEELRSEGSAQLADAARQAGDQIKSSLTAFQNGNAPSISPAANSPSGFSTTPGFGMPSPTGGMSGTGGTSAPGGITAPGGASAPSTSRNPNAARTAADTNAANGWSGYQPSTNPASPPPSAPSTIAGGNGYGTGAANTYTPRTGVPGSPSDPPSTFNTNLNSNTNPLPNTGPVAPPYSNPNFSATNPTYAAPGYTQPGVANPGLGIPSGVDSAGYGNSGYGNSGYGASGIAPVKLTAEEQAIADQQLLAQIGFDVNGKAYDKQTGRLILDTDLRGPHIQEYIKRTNEKILLMRREQELLATTNTSANANLFDRNGQLQRAPNTINGPNWGVNTEDRFAQNNLFQPGSSGAYLPGGYSGGSLANTGLGNGGAPNSGGTASAQQPSNTQPQNAPASGGQSNGSSSKPAPETTGSAATKSPSDELERNREELKKSVRDITPQPVYNFMLIISVVVNVYLGIAISRLLRRYRNLIATHRGTSLSV